MVNIAYHGQHGIWILPVRFSTHIALGGLPLGLAHHFVLYLYADKSLKLLLFDNCSVLFVACWLELIPVMLQLNDSIHNGILIICVVHCVMYIVLLTYSPLEDVAVILNQYFLNMHQGLMYWKFLWNCPQWPLLLTWFNFNSSMDK